MALDTNLLSQSGDESNYSLDYIQSVPENWAIQLDVNEAGAAGFSFLLTDTVLGSHSSILNSSITVDGFTSAGSTISGGVESTNVFSPWANNDTILFTWDESTGTLSAENVTQATAAVTLTLTNATKYYPLVILEGHNAGTAADIDLGTATSTLTATLPAGFFAWGDTAGSNIDGIPGTRTTTTEQDGLTTVQIDTLAYNSFDAQGQLVVNPEVLGSPNTTGTFNPPAPHTYTQIVSPEVNEVRVTANGVTNITITEDAYTVLTETEDAPDVVITPQTGTGVSGDPFIDITTTTTPGGYTQSNVVNNQVVTTSQESALTCQQLQRDISDYVQAAECRLIAVLQTNDINSLEPSSSTDIGAILLSAGHDRTMVNYHPSSVTLVDGVKDLSKERLDGAILSAMTTTQEGAEQWDYQALVGISDSNLTGGQQDALTGKNIGFAERFQKTSFTHLFKGRMITGREMRIQWGADYISESVESSLATYAFNNELMAFDEPTFTDVEGILYNWRNVALDRRIIVDTRERPSTITMPDPDSFSAAERQSGTANIADAYCWSLNSSISEWNIKGDIKLGQNAG